MPWSTGVDWMLSRLRYRLRADRQVSEIQSNSLVRLAHNHVCASTPSTPSTLPSQCKLLMCWTHQSLRGIFIQVNWYICKICPVNLYMHSYSCWGPPHRKNNNNLLPIFYIRTFVPTRFWQYVNHSDLYILENSANLSSYLTTIVKIMWSTVDLLSLKKCKFVPISDHALVWQIRVGVHLISVMFQGWALINACQCRRWNEKCKINSNLWNTLTQTWNL